MFMRQHDIHSIPSPAGKRWMGLPIMALALAIVLAIFAGSAAQAAGKLGGSTGADEFNTDRGR